MEKSHVLSNKQSEKLLTKNEFNYCEVVKGLSKTDPARNQKEVALFYLDEKGEKIAVDFCHGVIAIFEISIPTREYFVLGIPGKNTDINAQDANELQASIGDNALLQEDNKRTISHSLNDMLENETCGIFPLVNFELSSYYVMHRVADWKLSYLKLVALSKTCLSLNELQEKITLTNDIRKSKCQNPYGIYKLDEVIKAAKETAMLSEGNKPSTIFMNYYQNQQEQFVILDDRAIDTLFNQFDFKDIEALFSTDFKTLDNISSLSTSSYEEQENTSPSFKYCAYKNFGFS